jgi:hypothetical protein
VELWLFYRPLWAFSQTTSFGSGLPALISTQAVYFANYIVAILNTSGQYVARTSNRILTILLILRVFAFGSQDASGQAVCRHSTPSG